MPSNKRQKELARRRAERQAARRAAERARRRKRRAIMGVTIGGVAAGVVLLIVLIATLRGDDDKGVDPAASASPTASAAPAPVACGAKQPPAPEKKTFEKEPKLDVDDKKTYTARVRTSCGEVEFSMNVKNAPRTVNSLAFLAKENFYDGTLCHRMTNSAGLTVLQCGDPEGTGAGGPGYTLGEENLKGAKYPRGTVAMAKTQEPNSTGSQFFLVIKDTELPPEYTVVGKVTEKSLAVLDKILALGIEGDATDGAPKQRVFIEDFTVTAK